MIEASFKLNPINEVFTLANIALDLLEKYFDAKVYYIHLFSKDIEKDEALLREESEKYIKDIMAKTKRWIPCKTINQCFVPDLERFGYAQFLITYLTGKNKRPQVTTTWFERGRILNKKYSQIVAYMPLPDPYKEETNDG